MVRIIELRWNDLIMLVFQKLTTLIFKYQILRLLRQLGLQTSSTLVQYFIVQKSKLLNRSLKVVEHKKVYKSPLSALLTGAKTKFMTVGVQGSVVYDDCSTLDESDHVESILTRV